MSGGLYLDNTFVRSAWQASDIVTLFFAVPLLAGSLAYGRTARGFLIWMGVLEAMQDEMRVAATAKARR